MDLSNSQIAAVRNGEAVRVDENGIECVVVRADVFDQIKIAYDDSEWSVPELRRILAKASLKNGWDEPEMAAYDNYDEEIKKRCE